MERAALQTLSLQIVRCVLGHNRGPYSDRFLRENIFRIVQADTGLGVLSPSTHPELRSRHHLREEGEVIRTRRGGRDIVDMLLA